MDGVADCIIGFCQCEIQQIWYGLGISKVVKSTVVDIINILTSSARGGGRGVVFRQAARQRVGSNLPLLYDLFS